MQDVRKILEDTLNGIGTTTEHIEAEEGDFIAGDGYLHCGKCGERKEFRLPFNGHMVPVLCDCGKAARYRNEEAARRRQAIARVNELKSYSLIDRRFRESTFANAIETPENAQALSIARKYCEHWEEVLEKNVGLLFYGPPGTGKTFISACIANELMRQNVPVLATSIIKLAGVDSETLDETLRWMRNADLVILDDFGAERGTDFMRERVFSVIDSRYANKRPLIVTTNIGLADMQDSTDINIMRVYQRLRAMCKIVKIDGPSWRQNEVDALNDWGI